MELSVFGFLFKTIDIQNHFTDQKFGGSKRSSYKKDTSVTTASDEASERTEEGPQEICG